MRDCRVISIAALVAAALVSTDSFTQSTTKATSVASSRRLD